MQQLKAFSFFKAGHLYIDDSTYHDLKSLLFKTISRRRVNGLMQIFHFNGSMFSFFLLKKMKCLIGRRGYAIVNFKLQWLLSMVKLFHVRP